VSRENVEILRRLIERWSDGDLEGFIESVDPEVEWRTSGLYLGVDPVYIGHEGFRKFWDDFHEMWETLTMELRDVVAVGDRVAFAFHFDATGRNGVRAGRDQAALATIRNGSLVRIENYETWDVALGALEASRRAAGTDATR